MALIRHKHILLQVVIVGCFTFMATRLALHFLMPSAHAQQSCCSMQSALRQNYLGESWPKNKTIAVIVQSAFGEAGKNELSAGIKSWNQYLNDSCSGVTFGDAQLVDFQVSDPTPAYTIRVLNRHPNALAIAAVEVTPGPDGRARSADIDIATGYSFSGLRYYGAHETGHTFGIENCNGCPLGSAVMTSYNESQTSPTQCDVQVVGKIYCTCSNGGTYRTCKECTNIGGTFVSTCACPSPTPSGCPPPPFCLEGLDGGSCNTPVDWCRYPFNEGCPDDYIANSCCCLFVGSLDTGDCGSSSGFACDVPFVGGCSNPYYGDPIYCGPSPLLVDVSGDGFSLTDAAGGVRFDLNNDGVAERVSWTAAGSDDAWLVFDRNHNGVIDSGRELFGNYTPQPLADPPNGLQALSVFDAPARGGNSDGVIDARDAVFAYLRLWQDSNHDGVSQPAELHTLPDLDVVRIHLDYKESKREDEYGNRFRYRAKVDDAKGAKVNRWTWDVFLVPGQ